jgi:sugar lactone lactonase YvrE
MSNFARTEKNKQPYTSRRFIMRRFLVATILLVATACSAKSPLPPNQSPGIAALTATAAGPRAQKIYVALNNEIATYPATANGNVSPSVLIAGAKTELAFADSLFVTNAGAIWTCPTSYRIVAFAAGAHGNVAPVRRINTNLVPCYGFAVDRTGRVAVVGGGGGGRVQIWNPGARGNAQPSQTIFGPRTQIDRPWGLAFSYPGALYVTSMADFPPSVAGQNIAAFAPTANGNATPLRVISGSNTGIAVPKSIFIDQWRNLIWIVNERGGSIEAFPLAADGNASPAIAIAGPRTRLENPLAVAVDAAGYVYASSPTTITVYAPAANGDVAPVQTITGSKVKLGFSLSVR